MYKKHVPFSKKKKEQKKNNPRYLIALHLSCLEIYWCISDWETYSITSILKVFDRINFFCAILMYIKLGSWYLLCYLSSDRRLTQLPIYFDWETYLITYTHAHSELLVSFIRILTKKSWKDSYIMQGLLKHFWYWYSFELLFSSGW